MEDWQEEFRERVRRLQGYCRSHPKEAAETVLLFVLLAISASWYFSGDEAEEQIAVKEPPPAQTQKKAPGAHLAVKGAELAAEDAPITNPFSFEHEERGTMVSRPAKKQDGQEKQAGAAEVEKKPMMPGDSSVHAGPSTAAPAADTSAPAPAEPALVLKGVAQSATQTLAVIRADGKSHFVSVGDTVGGFTVTAIDGDSVTLAGEAEMRVLRLPQH